MMKAVESMTDEELLAAGFDAVARQLGLVGFIRFVQILRPGSGDYTAERHSWLDGLTIEDLVQGISRRSEQPHQ
jgi:hypothetical protein